MLTFFGWTLVLCLSAVISAVTLNELHSLYLKGWIEFKRTECRVRDIKAGNELDLKLEDSTKEEVQ